MRKTGGKEHEREYDFSKRRRGFAPCLSCLNHSVGSCMCGWSSRGCFVHRGGRTFLFVLSCGKSLSGFYIYYE